MALDGTYGGLKTSVADFLNRGDLASAIPDFITLAEAQIPPDSVDVTFRTGETTTETWQADATGHGWIFVDDALAAVP